MKKTPSPPKFQPLDSESRRQLQAAEYAAIDAFVLPLLKAQALQVLRVCEGCGYRYDRGGCLCKDYS